MVPETPRAAEWSPEEMERIETLLQTLEEKERALSETEAACADALEALVRAEAAARDSFSAFYAAATPGDVHLPVDVAGAMNEWIACRKRWEAAVAAYLNAPISPARRPVRKRTGARLRATLPALLRIPTAEPAKDALSALFAPHLWQLDPAGSALLAQRNETQIRLDLDAVVGFGPEQAIRQIAKNGASAAQTFLTMAGLWLELNRGKPHETYLTVQASDLLRFQKRKQAGHGGYHRDDLLAKGRDVYLLSRISVPRSQVVSFDGGGQRVVKTLSIGRLLSLESLDTIEDSAAGTTTVHFRYHLGREFHDWVTGDQPQYAAVSGRLLNYHPVRQKYQILLGFCLAYYDGVSRKSRGAARGIRLPALLSLAAIPLPERRVAEFLQTIEDAINELARDGIVPGVRLEKPDDWTDLLARRRSREIISRSVVTFPRLNGSASLPSDVG